MMIYYFSQFCGWLGSAEQVCSLWMVTDEAASLPPPPPPPRSGPVLKHSGWSIHTSGSSWFSSIQPLSGFPTSISLSQASLLKLPRESKSRSYQASQDLGPEPTQHHFYCFLLVRTGHKSVEMEGERLSTPGWKEHHGSGERAETVGGHLWICPIKHAVNIGWMNARELTKAQK